MNLNIIQPKNETEDLLLLITKVCETLFEQTHRKAGETLEFKMIKRKETFHFKPPIHVRRMDVRIDRFRSLQFYF